MHLESAFPSLPCLRLQHDLLASMQTPYPTAPLRPLRDADFGELEPLLAVFYFYQPSDAQNSEQLRP